MEFIFSFLLAAIAGFLVAFFWPRRKTKKSIEPTYNYTFTSGVPPDATQRVRYIPSASPEKYINSSVQPMVVNTYDPYAYGLSNQLLVAEEIALRETPTVEVIEQPVIVEQVTYDTPSYDNYSSNDATGFSSDSSSGDFGGGGSGGDW